MSTTWYTCNSQNYSYDKTDVKYHHTRLKYRISGIFHVGLIFAEFATSLKSPKIDTAKDKPYYTSSLRVLEIAKIGLSEILTHLPSSFSPKFPDAKNFRYTVHKMECNDSFSKTHCLRRYYFIYFHNHKMLRAQQDWLYFIMQKRLNDICM